MQYTIASNYWAAFWNSVRASIRVVNVDDMLFQVERLCTFGASQVRQKHSPRQAMLIISTRPDSQHIDGVVNDATSQKSNDAF